MRRQLRALFGAAGVLAIACGGLLYNQGNAFPCDFSGPEATRDQACAPGEVCGVLGLCQRFVYEGPQFEGSPNLPSFDAGEKIHPLVLDGPVRVLGYNRSVNELLLLVSTDGGGVKSVRDELSFRPAPRLSLSQVKGAGVAQVALGGVNFGAGILSTGELQFNDGTGLLDAGWNPVRALRAGENVIAVLRRFDPPAGPTAAIIDRLHALTPLPGVGTAAGSKLNVLDLRWPPAPKKPGLPLPIVLTQQGFFFPSLLSDGGPGPFAPLSAGEDEVTIGIPQADPRPQRLMLRHDPTGSIWSFARAKSVLLLPSVLSTWLLAIKNDRPDSMARAWNDCSPCGNSRILAIAPNLDGVANVEVLCGAPGLAGGAPRLNLVRVIGASGIDPDSACETASVTPAFDLASAAGLDQPDEETGGAVLGSLASDETSGGGILVGGLHGEVWRGASFSHALPLYLDRVPLSVGSFPGADGGPLQLVVTDQYLAARVATEIGLNNGFRVFDLHDVSDFVLDENERVLALVGDSGGWALLSSGDLIHVDIRPGTVLGSGSFFSLDFGPRLVTARGEPTRAPFFGEAVRGFDGGLVSLVMTADDSVYLVPAPEESSARNGQPALFPQLTPEPGSPIRSFALERTPIGTDGVKRVRGYAVTSRSLYTVSLSGDPARWSASQILLGGGEPLKVWMDNPRGGLARVGYRDGTVFSLPGGFLLARPAAGQEPSQVLDYENLGGWPVAYSTRGLFEAHYDLLPVRSDAFPNGKLDNKLPDGRPGKPMVWRKVTLQDGSEPWMREPGDGGIAVARPGLLHVLAEPVGPAPRFAQRFRLFLYVDDAVYEVGSMVRTNSSLPTNTPR